MWLLSSRLPWTRLLWGVHPPPCLFVQVMSPSTSSFVGRVFKPYLLATPSLLPTPVIFVHLLRDFIRIIHYQFHPMYYYIKVSNSTATNSFLCIVKSLHLLISARHPSPASFGRWEPFGARKNVSPAWPGELVVDILNEKWVVKSVDLTVIGSKRCISSKYVARPAAVLSVEWLVSARIPFWMEAVPFNFNLPSCVKSGNLNDRAWFKGRWNSK